VIDSFRFPLIKIAFCGQGFFKVKGSNLNFRFQNEIKVDSRDLTPIALATLQRGYAIATLDEHVLRDATSVAVGDEIKVRLLHGSLGCKVMTQLP
jgi:exonuclease VII large subunit